MCRRQSRGIVPPADSPVPAARVRRAPETARARAGSDKPSAKRSEPSEKQRASDPETARRGRASSRTRDHATTIDRRSIDRRDRGVARRRSGAARRPDRVARRERAAISGKSRTSKRASTRRSRETRAGGGRGDALVAVGLPHHHGVGVGGLAGGDHGGLVEDGGDSGESGHFVVRIKVGPSDAFEHTSRISRLSQPLGAGRFSD